MLKSMDIGVGSNQGIIKLAIDKKICKELEVSKPPLFIHMLQCWI